MFLREKYWQNVFNAAYSLKPYQWSNLKGEEVNFRYDNNCSLLSGVKCYGENGKNAQQIITRTSDRVIIYR